MTVRLPVLHGTVRQAISEDCMWKPSPSVSTRTQEFTPLELPLLKPQDPPPRAELRERAPAERIKDALLRWLEEEL